MWNGKFESFRLLSGVRPRKNEASGIVTRRERNTVSELHHPEQNNDDYDDVADEHDLNKWLCPSTFTRGRDGREERV